MNKIRFTAALSVFSLALASSNSAEAQRYYLLNCTNEKLDVYVFMEPDDKPSGNTCNASRVTKETMSPGGEYVFQMEDLPACVQVSKPNSNVAAKFIPLEKTNPSSYNVFVKLWSNEFVFTRVKSSPSQNDPIACK